MLPDERLHRLGRVLDFLEEQIEHLGLLGYAREQLELFAHSRFVGGSGDREAIDEPVAEHEELDVLSGQSRDLDLLLRGCAYLGDGGFGDNNLNVIGRHIYVLVWFSCWAWGVCCFLLFVAKRINFESS